MLSVLMTNINQLPVISKDRIRMKERKREWVTAYHLEMVTKSEALTGEKIIPLWFVDS